MTLNSSNTPRSPKNMTLLSYPSTPTKTEKILSFEILERRRNFLKSLVGGGDLQTSAPPLAALSQKPSTFCTLARALAAVGLRDCENKKCSLCRLEAP